MSEWVFYVFWGLFVPSNHGHTKLFEKYQQNSAWCHFYESWIPNLIRITHIMPLICNIVQLRVIDFLLLRPPLSEDCWRRYGNQIQHSSRGLWKFTDHLWMINLHLNWPWGLYYIGDSINSMLIINSMCWILIGRFRDGDIKELKGFLWSFLFI